MNQKTAKLLRRVASKSEGRLSYRDLKRNWNRSPRNQRNNIRQDLIRIQSGE